MHQSITSVEIVSCSNLFIPWPQILFARNTCTYTSPACYLVIKYKYIFQYLVLGEKIRQIGDGQKHQYLDTNLRYMTPHRQVLNHMVVPLLAWYFLIRMGWGTGSSPTNVPCCRNLSISLSSVSPLQCNQEKNCRKLWAVLWHRAEEYEKPQKMLSC